MVCIWEVLDFWCKHLSASENYGKAFEDVTNLINNTFIRSEFGIAIGPENSGKVRHTLGELAQMWCYSNVCLILHAAFLVLNFFGLAFLGDPDSRCVWRSQVTNIYLWWFRKKFHPSGPAIYAPHADHIQPWQFQCAAGSQQQCKSWILKQYGLERPVLLVWFADKWVFSVYLNPSASGISPLPQCK